jgi:uncharacterized protein YbjT (DUF2867 family)
MPVELRADSSTTRADRGHHEVVRVLVTGATGYVGSRLVPRLLEAGRAVRCLTRSTNRLRDMPWVGRVEIAEGDLTRPATLPEALDGVDAAYYLVHSLGRPGFEDVDRTCADNFALAARAAGIDRIVHLGGPAPAPGGSPHLRSRGEVADRLLTSGVPTIVLRAAIIIGSGSASFEMLRYLTDRLPGMVTPRWVRNRVQPIAVRDVLHYLVEVLAAPGGVSRAFDIGGPDLLTFGELIQRYAAVAGLPPRVVLPVRPLTPELSALWVGLVTPVPPAIARPLVASLISEAVTHEHDIADIVPDPAGGLLRADDAIRLAINHPRGAPVGTPRLVPAIPEDPLPSDPPWSGGTVYTYRRERAVTAGAAQLWHAIQVAAAARGRTIGCWQPEHVVPGQAIRMRARMRMPGTAWLELRAEPHRRARSTYRQVVTFLPHGLAGVLGWALARPWHPLLYGGLARTVARHARRGVAGVLPASPDRAATPHPAIPGGGRGGDGRDRS